MYTGRVLTAPIIMLLLGLLFLTPVASFADDEDDVGEIVTNSADRKKVFGGCEEDPYAALAREGFIERGAIVVAQKDGTALVDGIDPALACRLLKFFRAAKSCAPRIKSGYRSKSAQARACVGVCGNSNGCSRRQGGNGGCAPPGTSCHQYGRAVDIESRCAEQMSAAARRYGLISRIPGYPNPNHYQCLEHGRSAGVSSCNRPCDGGMAITPGPDNFQPSATPSTSLANAARNFLSPQPAPQPSVPPQALPQSQQLPQEAPPLGSKNTTPYPVGTCAPQFYCMNSIYYYRTSTCIDQTYQKCPAGCAASGNACASTTTSSSLSTFDQIGLIAEPTSTPTGVVSDLLFELAISGEDVSTLQDRPPQPSATAQAEYGAALPFSQQTFVSGDLRYSQTEFQSQQSALQRTLSMMKDTLLRALAYLRPFGRSSSTADYDEWIE